MSIKRFEERGGEAGQAAFTLNSSAHACQAGLLVNINSSQTRSNFPVVDQSLHLLAQEAFVNLDPVVLADVRGRISAAFKKKFNFSCYCKH